MRLTTAPHDPLDAAIGQTVADVATATLWLLLAIVVAIVL